MTDKLVREDASYEDIKNYLDEKVKEQGLILTNNAVYMTFPATTANGSKYMGPGVAKMSMPEWTTDPIDKFVFAVDAFDPAVMAADLSRDFAQGIPADISEKFDKKVQSLADSLAEEFDIPRDNWKGLDVNVGEFLLANGIDVTFPKGWNPDATFRDIANSRDKYDLGSFNSYVTLEEKEAFRRPVWASLQSRIGQERQREVSARMNGLKDRHAHSVAKPERGRDKVGIEK